MAKLYKHQQTILISSGNNILIYDLHTGADHLLKAPEGKSPSTQTNEITSLSISNSKYLAVASKDKSLTLYDQDFKVVQEFSTSRVVSKVLVTTSKDIVIADKTGDVYLYKSKDGGLEEPRLLLGHQSVILDFAITECEKYIITCDRDEKIRVSHFPNCYNIASFCLGHTEFVTTVKVVKNLLISASGDGTIRFWDYLKGHQLNILDTNEHMGDNNLLEKFIQEVQEEKITVSALPVTSMEVHVCEKIFIANTVHSFNAIQIYSASLDGSDVQYLTKFCYDKPILYLLIDSLYIFDDSVNVFDYKKVQQSKIDLAQMQKVFQKYKDILCIEHSDSLSGLYKRKFDNIQEYLERKKQRLEIK